MELGWHVLGDDPLDQKQKVVVVHDWFCDTSSYDSAHRYLDLENAQYYFLDLRGYGASQKLSQGDFSAHEAAQDIIDTISALKLSNYHLIGHSMTGLVGQLVCVMDRDRIKSFTAVCPVTAKGMPEAPDEVFNFMLEAARGDDEKARAAIHLMTSHRHTDVFANYKVARWRETALQQAREGYCRMFVKTNIIDEIKGCAVPTQVICTQFDNDSHKRPEIEVTFGVWFKNLTITEIENAGHYPMQETPVSFADAINRWLEGVCKG